jgi:WD40 repeat protein
MIAGTISAALENPYPGLRAFEEEDCHRFFGRDQQVDELLERLSRSRFVAVVGLSGSGKSSLVKAGLIPALRGGYVARSKSRWRIATCRPGDNAISSLAEALREKAGLESSLQTSSHGLVRAASQLGSDEGLLVVVDQFEELFRYREKLRTEDEASRQRAALAAERAADFVRLLLTAAGNEEVSVYVVLTMRSDYLGDCAQFRDLPEALNGGQYLVPRMTREQRREAIEMPLGQETRISPALVQQLLNVAGDEPNQLPVLQHTLMRMWELHNHAAGEITADDYKQSGGFEDALNRHAHESYLSLGSDHRKKLAQWIFKRLTQKGRSERETRDPATLSSLWAVCGAKTDEARREVADVVDHFRQAPATFLTCKEEKLAPGSIIDITHESLIEKWNDLKTWVEQEAASAKVFLGLFEDARQWRRGRKDTLGGLELADAEWWERKHNPNPAWALDYADGDAQALALVQDYLKASRKKEEASRQKEEASRQKESTMERWRRQILWGAIGAALVFLALALLAWLYKDRAERSSTLASARQLAANAELLYSSTTDPPLSGLLATESMRRAPLVENDASLRKVLELLPRQVSRMEISEPVRKIVFSPDGRWIATADFDNTAHVWEAATGKEIARLQHSASVNSVVFSPDGRWVATASDDRTARVWEAATGKEIARLQHNGSVNSVVFSPDGRWVATTSSDSTARIWEANTGKEIVRLQHDGVVYSVVFSPDGRWVATASNDNTARVWEASTGKEIVRLQHDGSVDSVVFSPDRRWVATASYDTARVWEAATGKEIARLQHDGSVDSVVFRPDGLWVATASKDNTARIWEAATGKEIARLQHESIVTSVVFSPDGRWVATANFDKTAIVWEVATAKELARLTHDSPVDSVVFSPDGRWVATASSDRTARVWETATGKEIARLQHESIVTSVVFSPDGRWVATASKDNTARIWEAATGKEIAHVKHDNSVFSVVFSPDGRWVATASKDNTARIWEAATGKEIARLTHDGPVNSSVFSPDGRWVATASLDGTARIWEAATGKEIARLHHNEAVISVIFSPDGHWVATATTFTSFDGTAHVWDVATRIELAHVKRDSSVLSIIFSPDGRWVASGSRDGLVRVWQAATGNEIFGIRLPRAVINLEFFGRNQLRADTAEGSAHIFDIASHQEISRIPTDGVILAARFNDDQHVITLASRVGNEARITRAFLLPQDLINDACSRVTRNLSVAEWKQYVGDESYRRTCPNLPFPPDYGGAGSL